MGFLSEMGFGVRKRPTASAESKSVRESLIDYLNNEISIAEKRGLELQFNKIQKGDRKGSSIKEIRMWGDVEDGKRRMTLTGLNKKLYQSIEDAKSGIDYTFSNTDKNGVISEMKMIRDGINSSKEDSISMWYVKKNKETKEIKYIEVKI